MIRLDTINRTLSIVLTEAKTTNDLQVVVSYSDKTSTTYNGGTQLSNINGTTPVTICAAPADATIRGIDFISVYNADTLAKTVQIQILDTATSYQLVDVTLQVNDKLIYTDGAGWQVININGSVKTSVDVISSVFGRTGAIVAETGDYTATQVTNAETTVKKDAPSGYVGLSTTYQFQLINNAGTFTNLLTNASTQARTWTMQDRDYTIAGVDDITGGELSGAFTTLGASGLITGGVENGVELQTQGAPYSVHTSSLTNLGTRDDIGYFSYNVTPGTTGVKVVASEPILKLGMESNYTSDGINYVMEYNLDYTSADNSTNRRALGYSIDRATHASVWSFGGVSYSFSKDGVGSNPMFRLDLTNATNSIFELRFAGSSNEILQFGPTTYGVITSLSLGYGAATGTGGYTQSTSTAVNSLVNTNLVTSAYYDGALYRFSVNGVSSATAYGPATNNAYVIGLNGVLTVGSNQYGFIDQNLTYTPTASGTEVMSYRAYATVALGTHNLTNWYGFNSALFSKTGSGVLTNAYSFYANSPTAATNNYAFYSSGAAPSVLGGGLTAAGINSSDFIKSTHPTAGIGYATGAGGTVAQITSRTTGVTLSTVCGSIQTDTSSLAAGTSATFVVMNSTIAIGDVPLVAIRSGSNGGNTTVQVVGVTVDTFSIQVINNNAAGGTAETGAIVINFAIIKAVAA